MATTRVEREWMELVAALLTEPLVELPADRIAPQLLATFEASGVSYSEVEPTEPLRHTLWDGGLGAGKGDLLHWSIHRAAAEHPLLSYYFSTGLWTPRQIADLPAGHHLRWHADGGRDLAAACAAEQQLALPVRATAAMSRSFVIGRDSAWGVGEFALAERLWRLLSGLEKQVSALAAVTAGRGIAGAEIPLTPREQAVLGLLAQGLTAGTIARRLGISPRTVQKHLERCYVKLGVADRLAAVLRAQALGLV
jgi:DNA-binding CsgD family transcriptional regulator